MVLRDSADDRPGTAGYELDVGRFDGSVSNAIETNEHFHERPLSEELRTESHTIDKY
jgi:hypothetical protein